jgi:hypothetical protein
MIVVDAELEPLPCKHYSTNVTVTVKLYGDDYTFNIGISGYGPVASEREVAQGWEPEWGMDHTESVTHLALAKTIISALKENRSLDHEYWK